MYEFKIEMVRTALVKGVRLCEAARKMVNKHSEPDIHLINMEREFRVAVGECERVVKAMDEDKRRVLLEG